MHRMKTSVLDADMHPLAVIDAQRARTGERREYNCSRCGHTVDEHPTQFDYTDWDGSHHAKHPCGQCACAFYVPAT